MYLAESPAGALIEVLVHLELSPEELPPSYTLLRVAVPLELATELIEVPAGDAWKTDLATTRKLGDAWLEGGASALARVPSVILPHTFNVLLNPMHTATHHISIVETIRIHLDQRFLHSLRG